MTIDSDFCFTLVPSLSKYQDKRGGNDQKYYKPGELGSAAKYLK